MGKRSINGSDFAAMALSGAQFLQRNAEYVNALNVFPVPDGDTGTNMNLTMDSGVRELRAKSSTHLGKAAEALSKGLLMGARGNSGVILSQLFRGFSRSLAAYEEAGALQIAAALQHGVDLAYKAVVKPVEGTILTVSREAAMHAVQYARRHPDNIIGLMTEVYERANAALQKTPDLLPVLKQVGVVDSGGQGLVFIYEGFLHSLTDQVSGAESDAPLMTFEAAPPEEVAVPNAPALRQRTNPAAAQAQLATADIEFLYDMEFFIKRHISDNKVTFFDESAFKKMLEKDGDSILVIADDEIVKVHVHSRKPGDVLNAALPYGELTDICILNMREQHRELLEESPAVTVHTDFSAAELLAGQAPEGVSLSQIYERAPFGIVAVAMGNGVAEMFQASDVDIVLSGGQTMNPSTEDFMNAIESLSAEHIFLLPNNGNIILAAEQAAELSERNVTVIPTKTVLQGLSAMMAFKDSESAERNKEWMISAASHVQSGQVTVAVRDTAIDGVEIKEGQFIGIREKEIVVSNESLLEACKGLLARMLEDGGDLLTIISGEDAHEQLSHQLITWLDENYEDLELDLQNGGQPLYPYLFGLE